MRAFLERVNPFRKGGSGFPWKRTLLFFILLLILNYLHPHPPFQKPTLEPGDIAPRDVIAPLTFPILKGEDELRTEREEAAQGVLPVVQLDLQRSQEIKADIQTVSAELRKLRAEKDASTDKLELLADYHLDLPEETLALLVSKKGEKVVEEVKTAMDQFLDKGLIQDKGALQLGRERRVSIKTDDGEYARDLREIVSIAEAEASLKGKGIQIFAKEKDRFKSFVELSTHFLKPNLFFDLDETERRRDTARSEVKTTKGIVLKGEMIVRAHDPVTQRIADKLRSLDLALTPSRPPSLLPIVGRILMFALILSLFSVYLGFFKPRVFSNFGHLVLLSLLGVMMIGFSSLTISLKGIYYYLIPMAFASTSAALLLGGEVALFLTITVSLLISIYSGMHLAGPLVALFGGAAAIISVQGLRSRAQFYRSVLWVSGANLVAIVAIELFRSSPPPLLLKACSFGLLNGFGSVFLAIGFLPLFERLFGITTNITFLELSDLNRPILRRLAVEASGTYHHSLVVGTLSEVAAQAVGANSLLARVAAYHHDIGKLKKPEYYIENQTGLKNPHSKLTPKMSSLIVASHVKDGIEMAKEERLPKEIVDVIPQHHGTSLMAAFYQRAKALNPGEKLSDTDFRYSGPKPQTREAAIVMLADSVEATARSLDEPTASRLKGVVKSTIDKKLAEGQLEASGLTLADLHKIAESFLPILIGVFHPRLDYTKEEKNEDSYRKSGKKARREKDPSEEAGGADPQGGGN